MKTWTKILAALVLLTGAVCAKAQNQNLPQQNYAGGSSSSSSSPTPGSQISFGATVSPLAYGAKWDVKYISDAQWNNASQTINCPQSDCGFTSADNGKIEFGTNGALAALNSLQGAVIVPQGTLTVVSANQATASVASTSACTPNQATSSGCWFAWGTQDDTTAINNAATAAWATAASGKCLALELPSGFAFFSATIMQFSSTQLNSACGGGTGGSYSADATQVGPEVFGQGPGNTQLIPLPSYLPSVANCTGGSTGTACLMATPNQEAHDFAINGLGQMLAGNTAAVRLVEMDGSAVSGCTGSTLFNFVIAGWGVKLTNSIGLSMGDNACGDPTYTNIVSELAGARNCELWEEDETIVSGLACFGNSAGALIFQGVQAAVNSSIDTTGSYFGAQFGVACLISLNGGTINWNSSGDWINSQIAEAGPIDICVQSTSSGLANLNGDQLSENASNTVSGQIFSLGSSSTYTVKVKNSTIIYTGAANSLMVSNAGNTYFDDGSNTYTPGSVQSTISGPFVADGHSVQGACTGTVTAASTLGFYGTGPNETTTTCTSTTLGTGIVISGSRTLENLVVFAGTGGVNSSSGVVTVLKNGSTTTLTCTIGTGTKCSDTIHQVSAVNGDLISLQFTTQTADTLANVKAIATWN
jgi:hypothetical protein